MRGPPHYVVVAGLCSAAVVAGLAAFQFKQNQEAPALVASDAALNARSQLKRLQDDLQAKEFDARAQQIEVLKRRAQDLVRLADATTFGSVALAAGERVAEVEAGQFKEVVSQQVQTSSLSEAAPALVEALTRANAAAWADKDGVWAVGPQGGRRHFSFVALPRRAAVPDLQPALRSLANLAVEAPPETSAPRWWLFAALGVATGLLIGMFVWWRVDRPIQQALIAARHFSHGDDTARPVEQGTSMARDVARAIESLMDRTQRVGQRSRAVEERDLQAALSAVENLGQADLRGPIPRLEGALAPLGGAVEGARIELIDRVSHLHQAAAEVAQSQFESFDALRGLRDAAQVQRDFVRRLAEGAGEAGRELPQVQVNLTNVVEQLSEAAADQRRITTEVRDTLSRARTRCRDLAQSSAELRARLQKTERIADALDVLDRVAARGPDALPPAERLTRLSAEARTAFADVTRRLGELARDLDENERSLSALVERAPTAPVDPRSALEQPWSEASRLLVHNAERVVRALSGLHQHQEQIARSAEDAAAAADVGAAALPKLVDAWRRAKIGATFEEELLLRLQRGQAELEALDETPGAVTLDTQKVLQEVESAAAAARGRLEILVQAAEETMSILRR